MCIVIDIVSMIRQHYYVTAILDYCCARRAESLNQQIADVVPLQTNVSPQPRNRTWHPWRHHPCLGFAISDDGGYMCCVHVAHGWTGISIVHQGEYARLPTARSSHRPRIFKRREPRHTRSSRGELQIWIVVIDNDSWEVNRIGWWWILHCSTYVLRM